ncbi:DNA invertase Pin-like site-specific DNA recombinase [Aminobacter niigataensis]|uniref:DNA invertase Pin-like site-specific DNA recombinase n=1 Tax=Aminobacter niigataensis TaxID=83265 RepID=A0ABR6L442_9HYPH|nr:recombinase family protein [Aminobacter niigataensis]MBB4651396.1 DNA invertase Pin-like site-specific DNA recombinase [Aminobacter niigataensis]
MLVGYARTSTAEQAAGLEAQKRDLGGATGCTKLFVEQVSSVGEREQLKAALDFVREGDVLVCTRLDRLARSTSHLLAIVEELDRKGVGLRILDFGGGEVDTRSPSGRMLLTVFAAMAQFEREVMLQRQREGIALAKAAGKYKGRKATARAKQQSVLDLKAAGVGPSEIARQLGIGRASVYRLLTSCAQ